MDTALARKEAVSFSYPLVTHGSAPLHISYKATHGCSSNMKVRGHVRSSVWPGDSVRGAGRSNISSSNCGSNPLVSCFKHFKTYGRATTNLPMGLSPVLLGCSFSKRTATGKCFTHCIYLNCFSPSETWAADDDAGKSEHSEHMLALLVLRQQISAECATSGQLYTWFLGLHTLVSYAAIAPFP